MTWQQQIWYTEHNTNSQKTPQTWPRRWPMEHLSWVFRWKMTMWWVRKVTVYVYPHYFRLSSSTLCRAVLSVEWRFPNPEISNASLGITQSHYPQYQACLDLAVRMYFLMLFYTAVKCGKTKISVNLLFWSWGCTVFKKCTVTDVNLCLWKSVEFLLKSDEPNFLQLQHCS